MEFRRTRGGRQASTPTPAKLGSNPTSGGSGYGATGPAKRVGCENCRDLEPAAGGARFGGTAGRAPATARREWRRAWWSGKEQEAALWALGRPSESVAGSTTLCATAATARGVLELRSRLRGSGSTPEDGERRRRGARGRGGPNGGAVGGGGAVRPPKTAPTPAARVMKELQLECLHGMETREVLASAQRIGPP
ncbi:hypothetical protein BRADI_1g55352v3 [Brachypodium distachyon]|uniref:Uncharacterized protein n=1 Tax=Brachypodium distachyon TaxID=15368 RepID=A0A0Q3HDG4_BRADI|nr:hypothetical protein BRADI_1g55352v3 [Brachypodium distachyon]